MFKFSEQRAETRGVSAEPDEQQEPVRIAVVDGAIDVLPGELPARLTWNPETVRLTRAGSVVEGGACAVARGERLHAEVIQEPARVEYEVEVARDRMQATLRVVPRAGVRRTLPDLPAAAAVRLECTSEAIEAPQPDGVAARAALQEAGVVHGVRADAIDAAVAEPGTTVLVAEGTAPRDGRNGYLESLVDFQALQRVGVLDGTPLVRRVPMRPGEPGRDVLGRTIAVAAVREARLRAGIGVVVDDHGLIAIAAEDGAPSLDPDGRVEVRHELELAHVDMASGDVDFRGTVIVHGDVEDGRTVRARDEVVVEGNVDRACIEAGGSIRVDGSIMSSVLRAGGDRAVAATIADRVLDLPKELGLVAAQARQFRDQAASRDAEPSFGLSIQLVLERLHRGIVPSLVSIERTLRDAGGSHVDTAERVAAWHRMLATAANASLTMEQYGDIVSGVADLAGEVQRAIDEPADLVVSYVQASEATAAGTVTIVGKGIFNSRIVAWGGLVAEHRDAVLRGGTVTCHGRLAVYEIGSPAGATTLLQLGEGASVVADRAYAGTVVQAPGYTHRFVADRTCLTIGFGADGAMDVTSLAA